MKRAVCALLAAGCLAACTIPERNLELAEPAGAGTDSGGGDAGDDTSHSGGSVGPMNGSAAGGRTATGRATASGGTSSVGGTSTVGGTSSVGGTSTVGGTSSVGGTSTVGGSSSVGGTSTVGGTSSVGGTSTVGGTSSVGGTSTVGGTSSVGGTSTVGGSHPGTEFIPATKSCAGLATKCDGESCCTAIAVPGGTFLRGRGTATNSSDEYTDGVDNELPEQPATVDGFALDKFEVTVGRFRAFLNAYNAWHGGNPSYPQIGNGEHPKIGGTGWLTEFNTALPATYVEMLGSMSSCGDSTWTNSSSNNEASAINCVKWAEAFAFCIWDGGRLPTEAEWEYAAAGASENRLYSWGKAEPAAENVNSWGTTRSPSRAVGNKTPGYFGHQDLSGSMWEWVFDRYSSSYYGTVSTPTTCSNCANIAIPSNDPDCTYCRSARGGAWDTTVFNIRAARRGYFYPEGSRGGGMGFRCARSAPSTL